jgi:probable phosphoglycerate mutase
MHLYLVRHGQSYMNVREWSAVNGFRNVGLTEKGQQQATALAAWLPQVLPSVDAILASTMLRASETATPLAAAYGLPTQPDDRLREIGTNRHDHSPWSDEELPVYWTEEYWFSERPFSPVIPTTEGSETMMHFRLRVGALIEELVRTYRGKNIVLVCHGGVIEATFAHVFNVGPFQRCEVWSRNTAVTHFEYVEHPRREAWRLHYHNRTDHLNGTDL